MTTSVVRCGPHTLLPAAEVARIFEDHGSERSQRMAAALYAAERAIHGGTEPEQLLDDKDAVTRFLQRNKEALVFKSTGEKVGRTVSAVFIQTAELLEDEELRLVTTHGNKRYAHPHDPGNQLYLDVAKITEDKREIVFSGAGQI